MLFQSRRRPLQFWQMEKARLGTDPDDAAPSRGLAGERCGRSSVALSMRPRCFEGYNRATGLRIARTLAAGIEMSAFQRMISSGVVFLFAVCGTAHAQGDSFRVDRTLVFPFEDREGDGKVVKRDGIRVHIISPQDASRDAMDRYADTVQERFAVDAASEHQRTLFVVRFYKSDGTTPRSVYEVLYFYEARHGWVRLQQSRP